MSLRSPLGSQPAAPQPLPSPPGGQSGPANGLLSRSRSRGIARSIRLFRLFLLEQTQPEVFYRGLAEDSADQVSRHIGLADRTVVDVGGGAGYFTEAFRGRGAHCYLFEPDATELLSAGEPPAGAVQADGYWLPVGDASADVCFSSNVLEHVPDPNGLIDEMVRVTRPGGVIYLSFTNWYSPWGGHEMSPWHLLGTDFAARRFVRRYGRDPKHHVGSNLYRVHVGPVLGAMRARSDVQIIEALPRYYPRWCKFLLRLPGVREIAAWNLLLIVRRTG